MEFIAGDEHRLAAGQGHHVGIGDPARRRDHNLVARIEAGEECVEHNLLGVAAHRDLVNTVVEPMIATQALANCFPQWLDSGDRRVFRLPVADCPDASFTDRGRRVEIRLALAERNHIGALIAQLGGASRHDLGLRGTDDLEPF